MFLKYPDMENHYRDKYIARFLDFFPELASEEYAIFEKIHGANIQFIFSEGEMALASRRQLTDEGFNNVGEILPEYADVIDWFKKWSIKTGHLIRLYGEIFGLGVTKRINYGKKCIRFFDIKIDEVFQIPIEVYRFLNSPRKFGAGTLMVPYLNEGFPLTLEEALTFDVEIPSVLSPTDDIMEGVVIKPLNKVYTAPNGQTFYLKKKSKKFLENPEPKKDRKPADPSLVLLREKFKDYITKNRLDTLFSKIGEIERPNQIGEYIIAFMEDAKKDFIKDHEQVEDLTRDQCKFIFNAGQLIVPMLKEYL